MMTTAISKGQIPGERFKKQDDAAHREKRKDKNAFEWNTTDYLKDIMKETNLNTSFSKMLDEFFLGLLTLF